MDLDVDTTVDVTVGDALGSFIQFLETLRLKLLTRCLFCHLFQHPLNIGSGMLVQFSFVGVIV